MEVAARRAQDQKPGVKLGRKFRPILFYCATAAWGLALLVGLRWLSIFDGTPGATGLAVATWPADSILNRDNAGVTLVMSVHPRCACTAATIDELARVMAH